MQQYIGFRLLAGEYAIPIMKVREVINRPEITALPQASSFLAGVTNLRGAVIPVVNLKKLMDLPANGGAENKVIVLASGRMTFGVLVDGITGVMHINESAIEPPTSVPPGQAGQVEGVATFDHRLIVLLEPRKLIPLEDMGLLEDSFVDVREHASGRTVEVTRAVQTMAGEVRVKELMDAKEYFEKSRGMSARDQRQEIFDAITGFVVAIGNHHYEKADEAIQTIIRKGQGELFREVGKVTRKLHDAVKNFNEAIAPKLHEMTTVEVPGAADKLRFVIDKTEEAAHKTLETVEKYVLRMDDLAAHIRKVEGPAETTKYLKDFKNGLEDDLTEIITTQSFQDITGQTIRKVIGLVGDIEAELVRTIAAFGVKPETGSTMAAVVPELVSQADVDELLKEFGF